VFKLLLLVKSQCSDIVNFTASHPTIDQLLTSVFKKAEEALGVNDRSSDPEEKLYCGTGNVVV
jgi:hypothetical protein